VCPDALVVAGGPQLSFYPQEFLSFASIDLGVQGDGEETLLELVRRLESGGGLDDLAGTVVKTSEGVKINPARPFIEDLDRLPFPAVDMLELNNYRALTVEHPFFTMVSSRGCPYHCGFCTQAHCGDRVRQRSAENLAQEIEEYLTKYAAREIIMFDETFTLNRRRVLEICRLIAERKLRFRWNIRTRVDTIDEEMLRALKAAGCYGLHMGIESGDAGILEIMEKGITLQRVREAFALARRLGFMTRGYFMIGYLGENRQTYRATVDLARELNMDWASFSITTPLPATPLYRAALEKGLIGEDYWKEYTLLKRNGHDYPHLVTSQTGEEELHRMLKQAYRSFYLRPRFIWQRLASLRSWWQARDLVQGLVVLAEVGG